MGVSIAPSAIERDTLPLNIAELPKTLLQGPPEMRSSGNKAFVQKTDVVKLRDLLCVDRKAKRQEKSAKHESEEFC